MPSIINYDLYEVAITVDKLAYLKIETSKLNVSFIFVREVHNEEIHEILINSILPKGVRNFDEK